MNGPFQVAQASGTAASSTNGTPVRIYKLTKPLTDQAVMVNLGYDQKVKVDFSAIANEKITLVHVGEKLIILFDNQSTVTVEPVFKSRADGLGDETRDDITVEMAPGRDVSVSEFATLFPITTDISVLPATDQDGHSNANAQASGAYFSPFSVDPFDPVPLNQLAPQEELGNFVIEIPTGGTSILGAPAGIVTSEETPPPAALPTILAGLVPGLVVDESFLTAATNVIPGSTPNAVLTIATGVVPFIVDAPAGQQSLTFALSVSAAGVDSGLIDSQTSHHVFLFLENGEVVGREGANSAAAVGGARDFTISVDAAGKMTLTDLRSVQQGAGETGDISEGTHLPAGLVSLTATVTDTNNASASAAVDIGPFLTLLDDGPTAHVDSGNVAEGGLLTVAAAGVLVNDVAGADGFTAGGGVVGVRAAGGDLTTDVTTGVNTAIAGLHGTLVLQADGGYIYKSIANNITADTTDVFVYTVKDGDGDLSTTTLTINLANVTVSATDTDALVNEAGLPIGSDAASDSEIFNGSITPSGGTGPYTFTLNSPAIGSHGTLLLNAATGAYTYTLTSPFDTTPDSATTATQTEQNKDSFSYTVTDANGDTATGTILVDIIDDVPTAHVDSGNVNEGALLTVGPAGVLVNDVAGADGFTVGGGVVGVRAAGGDLTTDVTTGVNTPIAGQHGTLVLQATGGYTYQSTADNITADTTDVFVYTIRDGDGDLSTTTLTINLANAAVVAPADNDVTVNENALDTTTTAPDLAHGTVTGSLPGSPAETDASNQLNGSGGFGTLTYALVSGGNAATAGTFGTIQVNADGSYVYTLTSPFTEPTANNGTDTVNAAESFTYRVTDANGNTATGTININIVDDVPTAHVDVNAAEAGQTVTGNVETNDTAGADGIASIAWAGAVGNTVTLAHGVLTFDATGGYSYHANANTSGTDVFNYTITDGDGDTSPSTLTITVTNGQPSVSPTSATVNEAALDAVTDPGDLGHGTVTGSNPSLTTETTTGTLTFSDPDAPVTVTGVAAGNVGSDVSGNVGTNVTGIYGLLHVDANGSYTYTLTSPYDTSPDANNGTNTEPARDVFTFTVTDGLGNTSTSTVSISIIDDVPTAHVDVNDAEAGQTVTGNVETNDTAGADGIASIAWAGAVGNTVTLAHGVLTFDATGGYSYHANANTSGTDVFNYTITDGDGDTSPSTLTITVTNGQPSVSPTSATVNEAALDAVTDPGDLGHGTVTGSNPSLTTETTTGTLTFSDPDAPVTVTGVAAGNVGSDVSGNVGTNVTGIYGLLHVDANGSYTYTLTSPYDTSPDANNGTNTEPARDVFTFTVTDGLGNTSTSTVSISIIDDVPTAHVDSGSVNEGGLLTVAAAGVLTNDVAGADGFAAGGGVVGVRAAGSDLTTDVTTGVNTSIAGLHGTLVLQASGGYTYQSTANNITADTTDVFVYTVKDGDGDLSTTTLTINLANATVVAPADNDVTVNENALDTTITGSDLAAGTITGSLGTSSAAETDATNQLNGSGGFGTLTYALVSGGNAATAGTFGTIQVHADGSYVYTLTKPFDTSPDANNGTNTEVAESFTYRVTDANGNTATGTITVNIIDDVPTAHVDVNDAEAGQTVTGNVETNDTAGADGIASIAWAGAVGNTVTLAHGVLTFDATGGYSYHANANTSGTDVFNYTITDGDGDTSPSTLTITVTNGQPSVSPTSATVNEAALDAVTDPGDLGHGTVTGSNPSLTTETTTGTLTFSDPDAPVTVTGVAAGNVGSDVSGNVGTNVTGIYGLLHVDANGSYTYTLTSPYDTSPDANNGTNTEPARDVFTFTVTDGLGNTSTSTVSISIIDDVPTAHVDSGSVNEGGLLTVAAAGVLTNDVAGADGATIDGVRAAGGDTTTAVSGGVGTNIAGLHGTLHLNADGGYTYQSTANNITANTTDVFVYTIKDGDGDLSTTTLTINLANATVVAPADNDVTVNENALDTTITGSDLAAGTITGSLGTSSAAETDATNQLNGSGGFGTLTYALVSGGNAATAGTFGTIQVHADGSYVYTLTKPFDTSPDANNGTNTEVAESFTYRVTDANGNTATGTITVNIIDDVPSNISPRPAVLTNGSGSATTSLDIVDTNTDNNYGADGGTVIFAASLNGQDSGLTSSARKIFYQTSDGGHTLTGFADQNLNGVYDPGIDTTAIFTIKLNLDKSLAIASDTYTVQMLHTVDSAIHIDFNSGGYNFVGGNNSWAEFIPANETVANPIDNNSPDLLLTPSVNHQFASSINTSATSGGVGSGQSVGSVGNLPETFRIDFVTDLRGNPADSGPADYGNPANRDHVFDGHYTVDGSSADFTATSGSTINIAAFDDPDGNTIVGDGVKDTITGVVIRFGGSTSGFIDLTQPLLPSYSVGGHTFTITEINDGSINVDGVAGTTSIATFTANGYNSLEFTWVAGGTFKIGNFGAAEQSSDPVDFSVPVQVVDGDGDTASGNLGIRLTTPGGPNPDASVDIAASLLTEPNASSVVTIHFTEPVTGFGVNDLTASGGALSAFHPINGDTYQATFTANPEFDGTGQVILTGPYTDLALNPGITGATDTVDVNTLASTLDATIITDTNPLGQAVYLTFVDLQNPIFSYAGLYNLDAPGDTFLRDAGFDINPAKEYAVSLEPANGTLVPLTGLTVEGITIHGQPGNQLTVGLQLDNDNLIALHQTALTAIIQPNSLTPLIPNQAETASVDGNADANNGLFDPTVTAGTGAGSAENTVNYIYGAAGRDTLTGDNDTDVLNGGSGNDQLAGGAGNDILIYNLDDQKIDGGDGVDVLRSDEAAFGLLNNVGVSTDAVTGFSVVEVFSNKTNIKNIEVLLITDDAGSSPTKGGLLNLTAKDVLDMTDPNNHTLNVLGNPGDVVNLGVGASTWNNNGGALDANGFHTYSQTFEGINLILKVEHDVVVH